MLALVRLLLGFAEFGRSHLFEILPDFKRWCVFISVLLAFSV